MSAILLTPTWSGDRDHFALLRQTLARSGLADVPHQVVVQTEDEAAFRPFVEGAVSLQTTAEVLPGPIEARRQQARRHSARLGVWGTRMAGSLALRAGGFPQWTRYTGWHVQQISKLAAAAASPVDTVVVVDCDVAVLPGAGLADFVDAQGRIVCLHRQAPASAMGTKQRRWCTQAHALLQQPMPSSGLLDTSFDTPFVFHAPTVRRFFAYLEQRHDQPWWQVLLSQPVRRWSEFASYRLFLRHHVPAEQVKWRITDRLIQPIYNEPTPAAVAQRFSELMAVPGTHYTTIHTQSGGKRLWGADAYAPLLLAQLDAAGNA